LAASNHLVVCLLNNRSDGDVLPDDPPPAVVCDCLFNILLISDCKSERNSIGMFLAGVKFKNKYVVYYLDGLNNL
jgi:hypothetical protein